MPPKKYRRKPRGLEAVQVAPQNVADMEELLGPGFTGTYTHQGGNHSVVGPVPTDGSEQLVANQGDWVIKDLRGRLSAMTNAAFSETFEENV